MIDVEFSLALHNRTGKFFLGRDILEDQNDLVRSIWFWRKQYGRPPARATSRVLGKLMAAEINARQHLSGLSQSMKLRPNRPVLHTDPFSVVIHALQRSDAILCHDVGPLTHPALFAPDVTALYRRAYAEIALAKPHMVFVSDATRRSFASLFGDDFASMEVIHAHLRAEVDSSREVSPVAVSKPFLLTVGNVGARKNHLASINAFEASGLGREGVSYVLVGGTEPGGTDALSRAREVEGVKYLGYVGDGELAWLYGNATGFVLLSQLEGFGMPVAEAAHRGVVPLVASSSVLEEVAGSGALAEQPSDRAAVAAAMRRLVSMSSEERDARRSALRDSTKRFGRDTFSRAWRSLIENRMIRDFVERP
jgi:glycosyltransferase involved in cell wall biosynthesis